MMDALLLPSVDTTEAFGVVQIEAQLMSVPVIASSLPTGVTDVTLDNETGLLVPPRDPEALGEAILRLIRRSGSSRLRHLARGPSSRAQEFHLGSLSSIDSAGRFFDVILAGQPIDGLGQLIHVSDASR